MTDVAGALAWQEAEVTRVASLTPAVKSFAFRLDRPFAFRAGQHVDVRLTAPDGYAAQRSYSIASAPCELDADGEIELAVELMPEGEVSPFFHEVAAVGDRIELRGPIGGHFVWPERPMPVVLVGGGSGVVPLMAMARHRARLAERAPALLVVSAPSWNDVVYRDELIALESRGEGLTLVIALTREAARRPGDVARRVDPAMMADALARLGETPSLAFVCGGNPFVETAVTALMANAVPASIIRTERFGG